MRHLFVSAYNIMMLHLFFSAFRFYGLKVPTANTSLWFYSVQGLFRVAFEMYSKQEQLSVLENFQVKYCLHCV